MALRNLLCTIIAAFGSCAASACTCKPALDLIQELHALFPYIQDGTRNTSQYALVKVAIGKPTPDGKGIFLTRLDTYFGRAAQPVLTARSGDQADCGVDFSYYAKHENDTFIFFLHRAPNWIGASPETETFTASICHSALRVRNDSVWGGAYVESFTKKGFPLGRLEDSLRGMTRSLTIGESLEQRQLKLWPNPVKAGQQLMLQTPGTGPAILSIVDLQGRKCANVSWMSSGSELSTIQLPQLAVGIYSAEIVQNGRRYRELLSVSGE